MTVTWRTVKLDPNIGTVSDDDVLVFDSVNKVWTKATTLGVAQVPDLTLAKITDAGTAAAVDTGTGDANVPTVADGKTLYVPHAKASDSGLFVSPDGDDSNDGLSPGGARKSLSATAAMLPASGGNVTLIDGAHTLDAPLPTTSGVTYEAINGATVTVSSGPLLAVSAANVSRLTFRRLTLHGVAHLIDLSGSGGLIQSVFEDVSFTLAAGGASAVHVEGNASYQQNSVVRGFVTRAPTATVPAFHVVDAVGAANGNLFDRLTIYGQNGTAAPAIHIEAATQGSWAYDNRFVGIIGEQNCGGLLRLLSNFAPWIENCGDWDATVNYAADVIRLDASSTNTLKSTNPVIVSSGRRGGTLGAGFYDVACPSTGAAGAIILDAGGQSSPQILGGDVVVVGGVMTLGRALNIGNQSSPNASIKPAYASADGLLLQPTVAGYAGALLAIRDQTSTHHRLSISNLGTISWGPDTAAPDVAVRRAAAGILAVSGSLAVSNELMLNGSVAASTPGAVVKKIQIFDYITGTSLGYLPIYDTIT